MSKLPLPGQSPNIARFLRERRGRNLAMLVALVAFAALFYAIAMVKMGKVG